jgi:peptidoglycan/LPS O-acetylase OafA/YrhL
MVKQQLHLKGLDTFRAISVVVVFMCHVELFKSKMGMDNFFKLPFFDKTGGFIAVILFFTLSGFLITFMLTKEKEKFKEISLKQFYFRRILRVWPLYFLVILLSYFFSDFSPNYVTLILCLTIFPNIAHAFGMGWGGSPQIWTIGVEEQFYLFWPLLMKLFKNLLFVTFIVFVIFSLLPHVVLYFINKYYPDPEILKLVNTLFYVTKFNCMASGGFFAVLLSNNSKVIGILNKNIVVSYVLIFLPFILWFSSFYLNFFNEEFYAILFSIAMLVIVTNKSVLDIDSKISLFIGKMSYGIYMFHWIVIELLFKNGVFKNCDNGLLSNLIIYSSTFGISLVLAVLSYKYFEKPFLNLKERYNR